MAAPFLALKAKPWAFKPSARLGTEEALFAKAMRRDPVSFLQPAVGEVRSGLGGTFTAAVASGLSVRLWRQLRGSAVWDGAATEGVSPPPLKHQKAAVRDASAAAIRYVFASAQRPTSSFAAPGQDTTTVTLYMPERPPALPAASATIASGEAGGGAASGGEGGDVGEEGAGTGSGGSSD